MSDLDLLERMRLDVPPATELARRNARRRLLAVMLAPRLAPLRSRRRRLSGHHRIAAAATIAAVTAGVIAVGVTGLPGSSPTSAANAAVRALRQAATNAAATTQPIARPGQYIHVTTVAEGLDFAGHIAYRDPGITDLWLPADGRGLGYIRTTVGQPIFQRDGDAAELRASGMWPADVGTTTVSSFTSADRLKDNLVTPSYAYLASLPTDPHDLYNQLAGYVRACHCGQGFSQQMLDTVATMLANGTPTTALRAALYQVASRIPGVSLTAATTTLNGRTGTAVGFTSEGVRSEVIFDPTTGTYLGQRDTWLHPDPEHEIGPDGLSGQTSTTITVTDTVPPNIRNNATNRQYTRDE
jgi:RNA polymerase sigma-70 factor (ECF subfamily)